ncbi:glycoside hydrolase family 61 protein [Rutstroemia sp. NJR-2017a BBW]|nr:glycoside hydrolase family 61 protein [Rutstroemia sp. NJR-2017a BBW]
MSFSKISVMAGAAFISSVAAHGFVQNIEAEGVWYTGYNPSFQYQTPAPVVAGWSDPKDSDNGFVAPDAYATGDIICHKSATNGQGYVNVTAGSDVTLAWNTWPVSHHGPVLDYLASCDGDCTTVDKTGLEFFKIDGVGHISGSNPGIWATDNLIANNNSWAVNIPSTLAPGPYVLRHEIIALHSANQADGAQNYPQCINLWVSGTGTESPSGEVATKFYTETDPSIQFNLYQDFSSYSVPGPAQWSGATSSAPLSAYSATPTGGAVATGAASSVAASSAVASATIASSSAVATSAAVSQASSAVAASSATSAVVSATSAASAVVATSAASSSKKSCSKAATSVLSSAQVAVVTPAPVASSAAAAGGSNVVTQEITDYEWVTDIVTETVTAGAKKMRRHARDVRA